MRARSSGPKALSQSLARLTAPMFRRRGFADGAIAAEWSAIVGPRLAEVSAPERIAFPPRRRTGGTLRLRIANSGLALELLHLQPQVIERINGYFGYDAVARLQLVHGPLPARPRRPAPISRPLTPEEERRLDSVLTGIDDPELRQALETLGRSVIGGEAPTDTTERRPPPDRRPDG